MKKRVFEGISIFSNVSRGQVSRKIFIISRAISERSAFAFTEAVLWFYSSTEDGMNDLVTSKSIFADSFIFGFEVRGCIAIDPIGN